MLHFLVQVVFFFTLILIAGYVVPAGQFYLRFFVFQSERTRKKRIQDHVPTRADMWREVRYSLVTIAIFGVLAALLWRSYLRGETSIYWDWKRYPWYYHPLSFLLVLIFHDTYFYWMHRLMHWRPLFKYAHLGHHKSRAPTPWAIFAFQPAEAVIQFGIVALPVLYLPLHPLVLLVYLSYDSFINTAGHSGHEIFPARLARIWPFKWLNTVTHHDSHHTNVRVNYGAFFNIWDRLMGTFLDSPAGEPQGGTSPHSPQKNLVPPLAPGASTGDRGPG